MTSYLIPLPSGLKFSDWGAVVAEQLASFGVPHPSSDADWKVWACALFYVPALTARGLPSPDSYGTWDKWAERFVEVMG